MSALSTARKLTSDQWLVLLRAAVLLPLVDVSLRLRGYAATRSAFIGNPRPTPGDADLSAAREVAHAVAIAARRIPWPSTCLRQAIVLERFLVARGIPATVRIGVSTDRDLLSERGPTDRVAAHAWVEVGGEVILGGEQSARRYAPLL